MKKHSNSMNKLIYNNRFVMLFSLVLAITIWFVVAIQFSPPEERIIKGVPVKIDMSQTIDAFDLQIFGTSDFTVDVTVTGKRYVVAQSALTADDIIVTANTNYVDAAGKYSLQLDVKKKTTEAEFTISEISNEFVEVYFDTYKESEYTLVPDIVSSGGIIPDGYYKDTEILSAKTVTISGPATEMNKIDKVFARITVENLLTATKTIQAEIIPLGDYDSVLRYLTINNGNADITITIPIYKIVTLPVTVSFKNIPANYISNPLEFSCIPKNATFGIDESLLESTKEVSIAAIDFSAIRSGKNEISIQSSAIKQAKVLDDNNVFKVTVNAGNVTEKRLSVSQQNISIINTNTENNITLRSKNITNVTVVGQKPSIDNVLSADVYAEIDLENKVLENGIVSAPARLFVKNYDNCWVYGQYTVELVVSA